MEINKQDQTINNETKERSTSPLAAHVSVKQQFSIVLFFIGVVLIGIIGANMDRATEFLNRLFAFGSVYYVSANGSDAAAGTSTAPYATFAKALSVMEAGDTLRVYGGTYSESINVSISGTPSYGIVIEPVDGDRPVIDKAGADEPGVMITGSYVTIDGFEIRNADAYCVDIAGQHNTIKNSLVHDCMDHGIYTDGQYTTIDGNTVYRATKVNQNFSASSGWGSGIKVRVGGENTSIINNTVYNNYGEGIAVTRGVGAIVAGNTVYDNYSVNIYIDNSRDVDVERNMVYCTPNSGFERNGDRPYAIALGEEQYDGWGAQLANVRIINNITAFCYKGFQYFGADISGGGLDHVTVAFNTFWGNTGTAISIEEEPTKTRNTVIANNIVHSQTQVAYIASRTGITMHHNLWSEAPDDWMNADGTGDVVGNPQFIGTPSTDPNAYRISVASPARDAAGTVEGIGSDFIGTARYTSADPTADIGAYEYTAASTGVTGTVTPTNTSTPTGTATTTPTGTTTTTVTTTPTTTATPTQTPTSVATGTVTPTPTPSDNTSAPSCDNIVFYRGDTNVAPDGLRPGETVQIALVAPHVEAARIRINGGDWIETTTRNTNGELYINYIIPSSGSYSVEAEIQVNGQWY